MANHKRDERRASRKTTKNQELNDRIDTLEQNVKMAFFMSAQDNERINSLMIALLSHLDLIEAHDCNTEGCDATVLVPKIDGVEADPNCPKCGNEIDFLPPGQQTISEVVTGEEE